MPVCAPGELRKLRLPNTTIETVTVDEKEGSCRIIAVVTHPPAHDRVVVWVALPLRNWNGRFMGTGGGGFLGGRPENLHEPVAQGFAAAATNTGHEGASGSFALNPNGRLNWPEIRDHAYLATHDMTIVGKALTHAFYGKPARYAYFVGGSTGGRQGLMEAQRYPEDYDGILSKCPAITYAKLVLSLIWPQAVMRDKGHFVSRAKFDAATSAAIMACDASDGVTDGVIDDPIHCEWDPGTMVGTKVGEDTFSEADADVIRKIWEGPRSRDGNFLWYGLLRGADLSVNARTAGTPLTGKPGGGELDWLRYFIAQNARYEATTLNRDEFELFFSQSSELYGATFGGDDPDLTRFRDRGGKLIIVHGLADQRVSPQGSIAYYESVQQKMGGPAKVADFARLFLVPGIDHSFRGAGSAPVDIEQAMIRWVEEGEAPRRLLAETRNQGKVTRTRPVYPYPQVARYTGRGDPNDAANFAAARVP